MKSLTIILENNLEKKKFKVLVCEGIFDKIKGLCFSKNSLPLLFSFNREVLLKIHSFFCSEFLAIWFDEDFKEISRLKIKKNRLNISPRKKFRYLLEIPINKQNKEILNFIKQSKKQSLKIQEILLKD